jgi:tetratricopeptide (TPR) repeat protein
MSVKHYVAILVGIGLTVSAPAALRAQGMPFMPAAEACGIKPNNKLVNNGMEALKNAATTKFADQRTKALKDAGRDLTQAVGSDGQDKNPAAWYYLGRYYLMTGEFGSADSALTKALALAPACKDDIGLHRRQAWVPVFNAGVQAWQTGNTDSAIASFRRANEVFQGEPMGFVYIANLFVAANEMDSAARYFRLAVPAASDPKYAKDRRDAFFNVARVYHSSKRYNEAKGAYKEYLGAYPSDIQAMAALAGLYLRDDKRDSALALYGAIVAHADSASAEDLFGAASTVLGVIPPSPDTADMDAACGKAQKKKNPALTARQISARCQPVAVDSMRKYHALADPQYRLVAQTYEAGLAKNPYYRDALYNLAGISYLVGDSSKVLPLAQRLYAVDPMNRLSLAKIAGGWQLLGKKDSVLHYLVLADSLPVEVTVGSFTTTEQGAGLEGLISNFHSKPSPPLKLTFEFMDGKGNVVASVPQEVPAVDAGANQSFKLKSTLPGIVAWRYKRS